jgi:hypothetical protein
MRSPYRSSLLSRNPRARLSCMTTDVKIKNMVNQVLTSMTLALAALRYLYGRLTYRRGWRYYPCLGADRFRLIQPAAMTVSTPNGSGEPSKGRCIEETIRSIARLTTRMPRRFSASSIAMGRKERQRDVRVGHRLSSLRETAE